MSAQIDASADLASSLTGALRSLKDHKVKTIGGHEGSKVRVYAPDAFEGDDSVDAVGVTRHTDEDIGVDSPIRSSGRASNKLRKPYFMLQALKSALQHVIVAGHSNVHRAVINEEMTPIGEEEGKSHSAPGTMAKEYYLLMKVMVWKLWV